MNDKLISVSLKNYPLRAYITDMSDCIKTLNTLHDTTPSAAAAAGRMTIAAALIGSMMKNSTDSVTCTVRCEGEIRRVTAVSDSSANVKCEIINPYTSVRLNEHGKIDVKSIVGRGELTVIKDIGFKQPYIGQTELVSGEIAEDFAYYFAKSEQIPSVVSLGVFVTTELRVAHAGGFIVQVMPDCPEFVIDFLEERARILPSPTQMLRDGYDCERVADAIFDGLDDYHILREIEPLYRCDCGEAKIEKIIASFGKEELLSIIEENEPLEIICHFCNRKYFVSIDQIKAIVNNA